MNLSPISYEGYESHRCNGQDLERALRSEDGEDTNVENPGGVVVALQSSSMPKKKR